MEGSLSTAFQFQHGIAGTASLPCSQTLYQVRARSANTMVETAADRKAGENVLTKVPMDVSDI